MQVVNLKRKASDLHLQPSGSATSITINNGDSCSTFCCLCSSCYCTCHKAADTFANHDPFPIGYRFYPTDEELISHYLLKKLRGEDLPKNIIVDVDIYKDHPQIIVENHAPAGEGQWYFFTPRKRKYVNGSRPDRKAGLGYWKATGLDKEISDDNGTKIGDKKALAYHIGKPPNGTKTEWLMHEYIAAGHQRQRHDKLDMKLDDYVLCKIYKKEETESKKAKKQTVVTDQQRLCVASISQDQNPTNLDVQNSTGVKVNEQPRVFVQNPSLVFDQNPNQESNLQKNVFNQNPNMIYSQGNPRNLPVPNSLDCHYGSMISQQHNVNPYMMNVQLVWPHVPPPSLPFAPPHACYDERTHCNFAGPSQPQAAAQVYQEANGGNVFDFFNGDDDQNASSFDYSMLMFDDSELQLITDALRTPVEPKDKNQTVAD